MNPATNPSIVDESFSAPIARIVAQEESLVFPLREYLEANGCRVISGVSDADAVTYYIVAGDLDYVKQIFASSNVRSMRTLGIVVGSHPSDAQIVATGNRKIVVVDPVTLSAPDVVEIFSFFFAGIDEVFDKRRNRHVLETPRYQEVKTVMPEDKKIDEEHEAQQRIGSIITDVFGAAVHKKKHHKPRIKNLLGKILLTLVVFCTPIVWYVASLAGSVVSFGLAAKQLKQGDAKASMRLEGFGEYWLTQGGVSFGILRVPLQILGQTQTVRGQERLLSFLRDIQSALKETHEVVALGKDASDIILSSQQTGRAESPAVVLERLRLSVTSLSGSLGLAQAQLASLLSDRAFPFFMGPVSRVGQEAHESLAKIRNTLSYGESFLLLYPRLAGFTEPKTYLVLLQNSSELRPTGGFIGSIGKLTFDGGVISDFVIQDVYVVDGQLKGHVDPPGPIRELLSQEHWYLRDSNWDPDFQKSGERAAWFYEKETGESVSGVFALSLPLVVDMLRVTGPVMLSDYNDQITADNFFGKSIFYTKGNFFPGSTAKSDFLGTLARTLLLKLTTDRNINATQLFEVLVLGISRRDVQFMFADTELQALVEHFGWAGRMFTDPGCEGVEQERCVFDPFAVNEANLSVSKVNAFVRHANHREIVIAPDGGITESFTMTVANTAENNEPGIGGTYRTYMRFFVPTDALISEITLDGVPVPSRDMAARTLPALPYIERVEAPDSSQGIAAAIDVIPGASRRLRISYTRQEKLVTSAPDTVLDVLQYKQAGLGDVAQTTVIRFPVFWKAADESVGSSELVAKDGEFEYNTSVFTDLSLRIRFTK